ncbi:protein-glutamine gamma-glutamyltransferase K-like [Branchiostoma floridae]|uniref:Protein-glutamine gamma-glutamyltransferase K-like n=1 Tax=Branchiostoma floridae TaxID=7739 RepID=A0A9J7LAF0_BRAFL|nr:protein-glutamine gamma-glutamyltransferase K-like [Branchiostoma floridae]
MPRRSRRQAAVRASSRLRDYYSGVTPGVPSRRRHASEDSTYSGGDSNVHKPTARNTGRFQVLNPDKKRQNKVIKHLEKPVVPPEKDEQLKVTNIDFREIGNRLAHHTDEFEKQVLIVRRGQLFDIGLDLNRPYSQAKDKIILEFRIGKYPKPSKGTLIKVTLGKEQLTTDKWGAKVQQTKGNFVGISVMAPANAIVGKFDFYVQTEHEGTKFRTAKDDKNAVIVLFNPWCRDDQVYIDDKAKLNEYVMNETGFIYVGNKRKIRGRPWNFGQFDDPVLDASLYLLDRARMAYTSRWNPINITRVLTAQINSLDDDGVLVGNWSGDYDDGVEPWVWNGSVKILEQFLKTKESVQYGQCWVFSGVTTSVLRCLGIPARSVTNFGSAHDTDSNLTVDYHFDDKDEPIEDLNNDSIWNFHVWNECWMARPDLPAGYGGWQAFDSTPQETSEGQYCCGPASLNAIKNGHVYYGYDTKFIFAEVNADRIYWRVPEDGDDWEQLRVEKYSVGCHISTKMVGSDEREDITHLYKHPEGTELERVAVREAVEHGNRPGTYVDRSIPEDVTFSIDTDDDVDIGEDFSVRVKLTNQSDQERYVTMYLTAQAMYYTGVSLGKFWNQRFTVRLTPNGDGEVKGRIDADLYVPRLVDQGGIKFFLMGHVRETQHLLNIVHGEVEGRIDADLYVPRLVDQGGIKFFLMDGEVEGRIDADLYVPRLVDQGGIKFFLMGHVRETQQSFAGQHDFRLGVPDLTLKVSDKDRIINIGQEVHVNVSFKNPINTALTKSAFYFEGPGLTADDKVIHHKDIGPRETATAVVKLKPKKKGKRKLMVSFTSKQLQQVCGECVLDIV